LFALVSYAVINFVGSSDGQPSEGETGKKGSCMRVSVIIPVFDEEKTIVATVDAVRSLGPDEVLVVDGGSRDRTREFSERAGARVLVGPRGRAGQMNQGAREATGDIFLFLHADTRLPPSALEDVRSALGDPKVVAGRFDVELDGAHWFLRVVGAMINFRSRLTKVATGDQAIFVRRTIFEQIGGFPDIPLMEDIAFSRALKRKGRVACLRSRVITSARRWEVEGVWRTVFKMWMIKLLYFAGVSPIRLKQYYADTR
jgi:rSAM/selenodomain-associated transferase 2